jgi:HD superfamily phosphohydrolase
VYPGANHTIFDHSLGTLAIAQKIIDYINANPYKEIEIKPYEQFFIRLSALLHDAGKAPFGHTLEDEGRILEPWWKEENIVNSVLGENSNFALEISRYRILRELSYLNRELQPTRILTKIRELIISVKSNQSELFDEPFVVDIVKTAELLDYIIRNAYFTGIIEAYDEKWLSNFYITEYNGKRRLVLRLISPQTKEIQKETFSSLLQFLQLYYSLVERVHNHRVTVAILAMLASAVNTMIQNGRLSIDNLYAMEDGELLSLMERSEGDREKRIIKNILDRNFYNIIYELTYDQNRIKGVEIAHEDRIMNELLDPRRRYEMERALEQMSNLDPGSVVIYCFSHKKMEDIMNIIVQCGPQQNDICPLNLFLIQKNKENIDIINTIMTKYRKLKKIYVLADPSLTEYERDKLRICCKRIFGIKSSEEKNGISIIIPAYNESFMIAHLISEIRSALNEARPYEILVVDDGSTDMTADIASDLGAIVIRHWSKKGYGQAVRSGVKEARYPIVVVMDAEGRYDPKDILHLIKPIEDGNADFVLGSRFLGKMRPYAMSLLEKISNRSITVIYNILGIKTTDSQTGFCAYLKRIAEKFPPIYNDFSYQGELLAIMAKKQFRIQEVPVTYRPRYGVKYAKFSLIRHAWNLFKFIYKLRGWLKYYG